MRAVVHDRYGGPEVLRLEDVERPMPADDEVLVRIHATTVTRTDCALRAAVPFFSRFLTGVLRPRHRILGTELAGEVAAVGPAVTGFRVGDRVFGIIGSGAHAEYATVREDRALATMPAGLSYDEAAAVCDGASIAMAGLRQADLGSDSRILVYGASGSIGTAVVQLARAAGAHVTAVCTTKNVDLMRSLGADEVIDYTRDDFTTNGQRYDVIFDAVGMHSFRRSRRSLLPRGRFFETDLGTFWHVPLFVLVTRLTGGQRVILPIPRYTKQEVLDLRALLEAGRFRAVIDRRYPLEDVVEATRYVESKQKTGNVVLTVIPEGRD